MTGRVQSLRSNVTGNRPASGTRQPGEIFTNWPDMAFGVIDNTQTAVDLLAVRFYSTTALYKVGDQAVYNGILYRCISASVTAGSFQPGSWTALLTQADMPLLNQRTPVGDVNYTMFPNDIYVCATQALTAPRTWTLPLANSVPAGRQVWVEDTANGATTTNTIKVAPQASDHINGAVTPITVCGLGAYQSRVFHSDGVSNWTTSNIQTSIDACTVGSVTPSTGKFTTLTTTGTASFGAAVTVTGNITSTGNIFAATAVTVTNGAVQAQGPNGIFYTYDRGNAGGNTSAAFGLYRDGNIGHLVMSDSNAGLSFDASGNVTTSSNLTVSGNFTSVGQVQSGWSAGCGFYFPDRDNSGVASLIYGSGNTGRLWRSNVGDCFSWGASGACTVAGPLTVGGTIYANGPNILAPSLNQNGVQLGSGAGIPLYLHCPNGTNCYMNFTLDGVRGFWCGQGSDQQFRIYDVSANHGHLTCNPANNGIILGGSTYVAADSVTASGMIRSGIVNGYVSYAISATVNPSNYAAFGPDVSNANSYFNLFTINGQASGVGSITTNGSSTFFNTTSDARLKERIRPLASEIDIGTLIDAIKPVAFEWLNVPDHPTGHGFVAQDLYEVVGRHVVRPGLEDHLDLHPWSADVSKLIPYMVAEMQALRKRVAELEAQHA